MQSREDTMTKLGRRTVLAGAAAATAVAAAGPGSATPAGAAAPKAETQAPGV
jgi:hypothetical protein